jgi:PAS domain S-box-containing protein
MQDSIQNDMVFAESRAVFSDIFHSISEGIIYANAKGKILAINRAMESITQMSQEQLIGKNGLFLAKKLLSAKNASIALPFIANILLNRDFQPIEIEYADKVLEITAKRNKDQNRIIGILRDITQRKQAEEALRKSENRFKKVFDMLPIGLWIADENGKLMQGNPAGVKIWGMEPKVGQNEYGVFKARRLPSQQEIAPDDWALAHTINESQTIVDELLEIDAFDGKKKIILNYTAPLLDSTGKVEGAIVVNQDITERKQAEEESRVLEDIVRKSGDFIGVADPEGKAFFVNPAGKEMLGLYKEKEETQTKIEDYFFPEDLEFFRNKILPTLMNQGYWSGEFRFRHFKTGEPVFVYYDLFLTLDPSTGRVQNLSTISRNITERKQAEKNLKESEEKYRSLFNKMMNAFALHEMIFDETGEAIDYKFLEVNPAWEKIVGIKAESVIGKRIKEIMPNIEDSWIQCYGKVAKTGISEAFEDYNAATHKYYQVYAYCPSYGKFAAIFNDITERKKAEEALRKSEERFQKMLGVVPDMISIHSPEMDILYSNWQGFAKIPDNKQIVNTKCYKTYRNHDHVCPDCNAKSVLETRKPFQRESQLPDGRWIDLRVIPFLDKDENVEMFMEWVRDITEHHNALEDLKRIEWMLSKSSESIKRNQNPFYGDLSELNTKRLILDSVGKNVLENIADDFLRLLETSSAVYERNGDYALGIFASSWCRYMDQASRALCDTQDNKEALNSGKWLCHDCCWKEASKQAIQSGQAVDIECTGGIRLYALPIFAGNEIIGAINFGYGDPPLEQEKIIELAEKYKVPSAELMNIARQYESRPPYIIDMAKKRLQASANLIGEIVSRKNAQKELLKLNEDLEQRVQDRTAQLEASNKELEAFSYSISHDLRAPLRHICGFIELLNQDFHEALPKEAQHYLDVVSRAAKQMSTLIDELLKFSRTGRQELQRSHISMTKLVNEILEEVKLNTQERDISWKLQELPQVLGDYSLLKQVWINLIDNAVKYTSKIKKAEISIGFEEEESRNVFFIKDNGVGFDMKYVDKIFGVFQRLHSDKEFEGIGIGLANVQRIIHKHLGEVWTQSIPNHETIFYFSLPK